ncbi:glycosyltransferase family 2 protein [soil metagenome]
MAETAPHPDPPSISVVIVTHNAGEAIEATLQALCAQLRDEDEVIVVDNDSSDGTVALVRSSAPGARTIETGTNLGFAGGCNRGVETASGDLLVLLNPDAVPSIGWRDGIERPMLCDRGWTAWQALVTQDGGERVNTRGGVVHFTGIAWAGGEGEHVGEMPRADGEEPGFVSGACMAIPLAEYLRLGGLAEEFFLHHEDVDLSLRVRLAGGVLGVERAARVDHAYEFDKGAPKWRYLERNRWATLLRTYPGSLLLLLAPGLIATEAALIFVALAGGWLPQKLRAWADVWRALPRLLRERRALKPLREVSAGRFAAGLTASLDSPYLGAAGRSRLLGGALGLYCRIVRALRGC